MKINRRQQEIALYIYKNPGCKLQYDMQAYYRNQGWHQDTVKKYFNLLKESSHIKVIDEGFYFVEDFIDLYQNIIEENRREELYKRN